MQMYVHDIHANKETHPKVDGLSSILVFISYKKFKPNRINLIVLYNFNASICKDLFYFSVPF